MKHAKNKVSLCLTMKATIFDKYGSKQYLTGALIKIHPVLPKINEKKKK